MAVSVNIEGNFKRFLSPTRFSIRPGNIHQRKYHRTRVLFSRESSLKRHTLKALGQKLSYKDSNVKKYLDPTVQSILRSTQNVKETVKGWSTTKIADINNLSSTRLAAAVNIDLLRRPSTAILQPKLLPYLIKKPVQGKENIETSQKSSSPANHGIVEKKAIPNELPQVQLSDEVNTSIPAENKNETKLSSLSANQYLDPTVVREQHDFYEAMTSKYESISSFNNSSYISPSLNIESSHRNEAKQAVKENKIPVSDKGIGSSFRNFLPHLHFLVPQPKKDTKEAIQKKKTFSKAALDKHVRDLTSSLKCAIEIPSKLRRLEDFCSFILQYPESRGVAFQEEVILLLLTWRQCKDKELQEKINEALAILGYVGPVKGHGIRVLALDGGGIRGIVSIKILQEMEKLCKRNPIEMFDYVCGVSTGSLIANLLFVRKCSLEEIEIIYREVSQRVFSRTRAKGAVKLVTDHSYYDSKLWEEVLKEHVSSKTLHETAKDPLCPKMSTVSSIVNVQKIQNYIFRNYDYPQGVWSNYQGSMSYKLWEAVKASSAAPGYFEECKYGELVHQDGGVLTNNPTAIAIHECKLLWPNTPLQCVVSIGTGRYEELDPARSPELSGLRDKIDKIVQSATDTEAVHLTVENLLPPTTYYRINPFLRENVTLDEIKDDMLGKMTDDTNLYCKRNNPKMLKMSKKLCEERKNHQRVSDWAKRKIDQYDLRITLPRFGSNKE